MPPHAVIGVEDRHLQPDYWIGGGDMNGPRISVDGCRSIYTPAAQGLRANGFNSVHMDSQDPKRILMLGNALWWGNLSPKRNERAPVKRCVLTLHS